jgi:AmiR/NasT family two-component response regulator
VDRKLRIVVADDDPIILDDLVRAMRGAGHEIAASTSNAAQLAEAIRQHRPDVVVFDIHFPDGDGLTTFRSSAGRLYATGHTVGGVAVSGDDSPATVARTTNSEQDILMYLVKPFGHNQLATTVQNAWAQATKIAALRAAKTDPKNAVIRAKAKLARRPGLNEEGAHQLLLRICEDEKCNLVAAAELILTERLHVGLFANRRKGKAARDRSPAESPEEPGLIHNHLPDHD